MTNMVVKPREVIGFTITVATITAAIVWWSISTFQSKESAAEDKRAIETRVTRVETELSTMRTDLSNIKSDTSYIRGRLEPRTDD